jgi:hypothetical protein
MFKYIVVLLALLCVMPATARAEYLTQQELLEMLARGGTTPKAMGMIPLRVCQVVGQSRNGGANRQTEKRIASNHIYGELVRYADKQDKAEPKWDWEVKCYREYQQMTPQLRATLQPSMVLPEVKRSVKTATKASPEAEKPKKLTRPTTSYNAPWDKLTRKQQQEIRSCQVLWNNKTIEGCQYQ